jgi:hypothetical protein
MRHRARSTQMGIDINCSFLMFSGVCDLIVGERDTQASPSHRELASFPGEVTLNCSPYPSATTNVPSLLQSNQEAKTESFWNPQSILTPSTSLHALHKSLSGAETSPPGPQILSPERAPSLVVPTEGCWLCSSWQMQLTSSLHFLHPRGIYSTVGCSHKEETSVTCQKAI